MTKASIDLQDLRRRLYVKAKAETSWRFWGLYVHVCKMETLRKAYALAKNNDGAPGVDGVTFAVIEAQGVEAFLGQIRDELVGRTYDFRRTTSSAVATMGEWRVASSRLSGKKICNRLRHDCGPGYRRYMPGVFNDDKFAVGDFRRQVFGIRHWGDNVPPAVENEGRQRYFGEPVLHVHHFEAFHQLDSVGTV